MVGNKPDYDVCVSEKRKGSDKRYAYRVGAAWRGDKGQISLRIAIPIFVGADTNIILFERDNEPGGNG